MTVQKTMLNNIIHINVIHIKYILFCCILGMHCLCAYDDCVVT